LNREAFAANSDYGKSVKEYDIFKDKISAVSGACMIVRRDLTDKIGLFEYSFGSYYEDSDFCLRVLSETDYQMGVATEASAYHYESASFSKFAAKKDFLILRNQYMLILRHFPMGMLVAAKIYFLKTRFMKRNFLHLKIFLSLFSLLPLILAFRIKGVIRKRKSIMSLLYDFLNPFEEEKGIYEYAVIADRKDLPQGYQVSEMIFGVNDDYIGKGFSPLTATFPQGRKINGKAIVYLLNSGENVFRMIWYGDSHIKVKIEEKSFTAENSPYILRSNFKRGLSGIEIESSPDNLFTRIGFADENS